MLLSRRGYRPPRLVVIGGGTGSFTLLSALKELTPDITALVSMADDGGSTGVLRDELGTLPPGDVRQCLVALSRSPRMRDLFNYRFTEGTFSGHNVGNIFLSGLEKVTGNFATAVETAGEILNIQGKVLPITLDDVRLVLKNGDGTHLHGEHVIEVSHFAAPGHRPELSLQPHASLNPKAAQAIRRADMIVIAPGDLYTSLGPLLIVEGVGEALAATKAKIAYVCNLVVKPGHTTGLSVADHASEIERFAGGHHVLDFVLYNTSKPRSEILNRYIKDGELLVAYAKDDFAHVSYQAIGKPLIAKRRVAPVAGDKLAAGRSLIRHDARAVARHLAELL